MPSPRKRIGFLPNENVHDIIDMICKENKYSQSKVTGILVEEALRSRGLMKSSFGNKDNNNNFEVYSSDERYNIASKNEFSRNDNFSSINKKNINEDLRMINDFIEYKIFKRVMKQNNNILDQ